MEDGKFSPAGILVTLFTKNNGSTPGRPSLALMSIRRDITTTL